MNTQLETTAQNNTLAKTNDLIASAKETILKGTQKSKNTQIAYKTAQNQYIKFCKDMQMVDSAKESVILFLESIKKLKLATLHLKISALSSYFETMQYDSFMQSKEYVLFRKGLIKTKGTAQKQAKAVQTKKDFQNIIENIKDLKHKTMFLVGFYGAFRFSELTALQVQNIEFESNRLTIRTYHSKTNQNGAEELKSIPKHKTKSFCAYRLLQKYIKENSLQGSDLLFKYSNVYTNRLVKRYFGKGFSTHSLRASFVTIAKKAGASNVQIMAQTKHKNDTMINRYYRNEQIHQENAVNFL